MLLRVLKVVVCAVVFVETSVYSAQPSLEKIGGNAKIDWTNLVYVATGEGAMPPPSEEKNRAKAYLKAKEYAKMAAIANLYMAIEGTTINYEALGRDFMADPVIKQRIEGFVRNVNITKTWREQVEGGTVVVVEVRAPMFADEGPGQVFLGAAAQSMGAEPDQSDQSKVNVILKPERISKAASSALPVSPDTSKMGSYTSLIIDATGLKLKRCMSPHIRRRDGSEVWGTVRSDPDFVLDKGIVSYATSMAAAKANPRAGSNPLVVRAIGVAGNKFYSDPVVSDDDARLILEANRESRFLDNFNVIFIKDSAL
ncbi:MAG: hypothetical protein QHI38_02430 [Armatimonadota bacterium]|nr:hypothetical protein [Armatimonadota bacterium]